MRRLKMADKSRKGRLRMMSISTVIPNLITVLALCSGLTGIRFAVHERWEFAVAAIGLAAILDTLDGRMARLLKGQSRFGAELDSLSDFISFGVAPALILFLEYRFSRRIWLDECPIFFYMYGSPACEVQYKIR
ncbi:MAG: hypothetical protein CM15mP62_09690 [Rhodospirillaceae bacterium]|nr:MAG: hypothetical protein CM15mP62_09690 [Rhodospirillaceae bacterium]